VRPQVLLHEYDAGLGETLGTRSGGARAEIRGAAHEGTELSQDTAYGFV